MTMNVTKCESLATMDVYGDAAPEELLLVSNHFGKHLLVRVNTDGTDRYVRLTRLALDKISDIVVNTEEASLSYDFSDRRGSGGKGGTGIYRGTKFLDRDALIAKIEHQLSSKQGGMTLDFPQTSDPE